MRLTFLIHLLQPAICRRLEGEPNSAFTLDHIPGSVVRGMFVHAWQAANNRADPLAGARELFFSDQVRFLNASLADSAGHRTLPCPLHFAVHKDDDSSQPKVLDRFEQADQQADEPLRIRHGWFLSLAIDGELSQPLYRVAVHHARDAEMGRATEKVGALFRHVALAAEQDFLAAIECQTANQHSALQALLENGAEMRLGKSRSAEYGKVGLRAVADEHWDTPPAPQAPQTQLVLTLLSPALLRDARGQPAVGPDAAALFPGLGARIDRCFVAVETVGGYNRKWNLMLPQQTAVAAGSSFRLVAASPFPAADLAELQRVGIGERRNEGFGQIAWGLPLPERFVARASRPSQPAPLLSADGQQSAEWLTGRLRQRRLERALAEQAVRLAEKWRPVKPTNSQISNLRRALALSDTSDRLGEMLQASGDTAQTKLAGLFQTFANDIVASCRSAAEGANIALGAARPSVISDWDLQRRLALKALALLAKPTGTPTRRTA